MPIKNNLLTPNVERFNEDHQYIYIFIAVKTRHIFLNWGGASCASARMNFNKYRRVYLCHQLWIYQLRAVHSLSFQDIYSCLMSTVQGGHANLNESIVGKVFKICTRFIAEIPYESHQLKFLDPTLLVASLWSLLAHPVF